VALFEKGDAAEQKRIEERRAKEKKSRPQLSVV
jgi:hypothetical protein